MLLQGKVSDDSRRRDFASLDERLFKKGKAGRIWNPGQKLAHTAYEFGADASR
jgi:hypothetical protein